MRLEGKKSQVTFKAATLTLVVTLDLNGHLQLTMEELMAEEEDRAVEDSRGLLLYDAGPPFSRLPGTQPSH